MNYKFSLRYLYRRIDDGTKWAITRASYKGHGTLVTEQYELQELVRVGSGRNPRTEKVDETDFCKVFAQTPAMIGSPLASWMFSSGDLAWCSNTGHKYRIDNTDNVNGTYTVTALNLPAHPTQIKNRVDFEAEHGHALRREFQSLKFMIGDRVKWPQVSVEGRVDAYSMDPIRGPMYSVAWDIHGGNTSLVPALDAERDWVYEGGGPRSQVFDGSKARLMVNGKVIAEGDYALDVNVTVSPPEKCPHNWRSSSTVPGKQYWCSKCDERR